MRPWCLSTINRVEGGSRVVIVVLLLQLHRQSLQYSLQRCIILSSDSGSRNIFTWSTARHHRFSWWGRSQYRIRLKILTTTVYCWCVRLFFAWNLTRFGLVSFSDSMKILWGTVGLNTFCTISQFEQSLAQVWRSVATMLGWGPWSANSSKIYSILWNTIHAKYFESKGKQSVWCNASIWWINCCRRLYYVSRVNWRNINVFICF